jgi:hypothetical protein
MKTIGDLLALVLNKEIQVKVTGQAKLKSNWNMIVEKAYAGNLSVVNEDREDNDHHNEIFEKNRINARRAADHSRIAYIKNDVLFIEADHQGWIQILQTMRKKIIEIINREYSSLSIRSIAFLLVNDVNSAVSDNKKICNEPEIKEYKQANEHNEEAYKNIKDDNLKSILIRLEDRISMGKN